MVTYDEQADAVAELRRGRLVAVTARFEQHQAEAGDTRSPYFIVASEVDFLEGPMKAMYRASPPDVSPGRTTAGDSGGITAALKGISLKEFVNEALRAAAVAQATAQVAASAKRPPR